MSELLEQLEALIAFARDPANRLWIAPGGTVARYVLEHVAAGSIDQRVSQRPAPAARGIGSNPAAPTRASI